MSGRAVIIEVSDEMVSDELQQATCVDGVDLIEVSDEHVIVGGDLSTYARRLTKQALAAKAGDNIELRDAARKAKSLLRRAEREMKP